MRPHSQAWYDACLKMAGIDFNKNTSQREVVEWWISSDDHHVMQVLGGERSGKSLIAAFILLVSMNPEKQGLYWIVGPDYRQARPEFMYLYGWLNDAGLIKDVSMPLSETSPWSFVTIWGTRVETRTGADVQKLASFSVDGIIMAEAAQQVNEAYLKLLGRISETHGFLVLVGTLERGLPWYGQVYERWQGSNQLSAKSFSLPTWSNLEVYPGGRQDPKILQLESEYPADMFMERFGAVPSRKSGRVLPEFDMATHVKRLVFNPDLPVELAIDPGQHTYAILFVQYDGLICNVLDRIYAKNQIVQDLIPEAMANPLWQYIDPDNPGVIDVAGKQHHANKSQTDLWRELAGINLYSKRRELDDTIAVLRYRLGVLNPLHAPLVYFNDHMGNQVDPTGIALDVLAEPLNWRWPDRGPNKNTAIKPIDKNNDAMKALGYSLLRRFDIHLQKKKRSAVQRRRYPW